MWSYILKGNERNVQGGPLENFHVGYVINSLSQNYIANSKLEREEIHGVIL